MFYQLFLELFPLVFGFYRQLQKLNTLLAGLN